MFKRFVRNIFLKEKASSVKFINYLRNKGVQVGSNVRFYSPSNTLVDVSAPWLLTIGDNVHITHGVIILTHDYSWSVLKRLPKSRGRILGAQSPVNIGNNVFIGMNAIITRGVTIGDNVVIGVGSIVTRDCEEGGVYAGNPAKKIMTIEEFLEKRAQKQFEEAKKLVLTYKEKMGVLPPKEALNEYFMLFMDADEAKNVPEFRRQLKTGATYEDSLLYMKNHSPMFEGYDAFLAECLKTD